MIRNYVKQYEAWQDLDPDKIELEPGTRKPSEKVLDQLFNDIRNDNLQGVKDYISCDYDVNTKDKRGNTPLIIAYKSGNTKASELLLKNGADKTVLEKFPQFLFEKIEENDKNFIISYIYFGFDVNVTGNKGERLSPLCYACELGNLDIIKLLLEAGADVNKKSVVGKTPIFYALKTGKTDYEISNIIKILLNAGADVNAKTPNGSTPLLFSVVNYSNNPTLLSILVKAGADLEAKDKLGITPLMEACLDGYKWNADWLIRNGADVNSKDKDGNTILLLSCEYTNTYDKNAHDRVEIIQKLLDNGANINVINKDGNTPLLFACDNNNIAVADLLIEAGANVNVKNIEGKTPLDIAISKINVPLVASLLRAGAEVYPIECTTDQRIKDLLIEYGAEE